MTINDVMIRDMAKAERAELEAKARKPVEGERMVGCAVVAAGILGVVLGIFLAWCAFAETPHSFPANARRGNFFLREGRAMNNCSYLVSPAARGIPPPVRVLSPTQKPHAPKGRNQRNLVTNGNLGTFMQPKEVIYAKS